AGCAPASQRRTGERLPRTTRRNCSGSGRTSRQSISPQPPLCSSRGGGRLHTMADEFVAVARAADLLPGQMKWVAVNGERRVLVNVAGTYYAISDVCGHRNAPLSRGKLERVLIECPLSFAQFDIPNRAFGRPPV